jgi:hypothetical protein
MMLPAPLPLRMFGVLAFVALGACAGGPQAVTPAQSHVSLEACTRNVQSAVSDTWFLCSLASASRAHEEAGRAAMGNADCMASPESCKAPDSSLVVRILFSPPAFGKGPPRASSIELAGFSEKRAHADMRELVGPEDWYTREQMGAAFERPPMTRGAAGGFDLSEQATTAILKLAHDLREKPEQPSWTICAVDQPGEEKDQVIMMGDAAGIFIQLFFGGEEHAYLRNSMYLGHAGDIAALLFGDPLNMEACVPDRRL